MNQPGNREITTADLELGELPYALPLEGWSGMTLHCQVDAIGPSDRHPDLVQLDVSFPPVARSRPTSPRAQPGINCPTCGPTTTEQHPRRPEVLRCVNCKEHQASGTAAAYPR
ncbi:hypothetical protein [Streptomyces sp. MBT33]|uniref:hypothetical protein n=1 Tax=Streptomyces sp. MBT33 TaxID=1488363 RepID=UPI001909EF9B|nr:hypothetical protein [Streptomyces sp. MBT33]MBK3639495.1 hypothetical protein [Streptomyces sp. MBT33]